MNHTLTFPKKTCLITINRYQAAYILTFTSIGLLLWSFGSYLIYIFEDSSPRACFPPLQGCAPISLAGERFLSGIFFRMTILPLTPFIGFSFFLALRFLVRLRSRLSLPVNGLLLITGVILCPVFLIISEAILNGQPSNPLASLHGLFAKLAFLMPVIYIVIFSSIIITVRQSWLAILMFVVSLITLLCLALIIYPAFPVAHLRTMMSWELLILICLWLLLMAGCMRKYEA